MLANSHKDSSVQQLLTKPPADSAKAEGMTEKSLLLPRSTTNCFGKFWTSQPVGTVRAGMGSLGHPFSSGFKHIVGCILSLLTFYLYHFEFDLISLYHFQSCFLFINVFFSFIVFFISRVKTPFVFVPVIQSLLPD